MEQFFVGLARNPLYCEYVPKKHTLSIYRKDKQSEKLAGLEKYMLGAQVYEKKVKGIKKGAKKGEKMGLPLYEGIEIRTG